MGSRWSEGGPHGQTRRQGHVYRPTVWVMLPGRLRVSGLEKGCSTSEDLLWTFQRYKPTGARVFADSSSGWIDIPAQHTDAAIRFLDGEEVRGALLSVKPWLVQTREMPTTARNLLQGFECSFRVSHTKWKDTLITYPSGIFKRVRARTETGAWRLLYTTVTNTLPSTLGSTETTSNGNGNEHKLRSREEVLELAWTLWAPETLVSLDAGSTFTSAHVRMELVNAVQIMK